MHGGQTLAEELIQAYQPYKGFLKGSPKWSSCMKGIKRLNQEGEGENLKKILEKFKTGKLFEELKKKDKGMPRLSGTGHVLAFAIRRVFPGLDGAVPDRKLVENVELFYAVAERLTIHTKKARQQLKTLNWSEVEALKFLASVRDPEVKQALTSLSASKLKMLCDLFHHLQPHAKGEEAIHIVNAFANLPEDDGFTEIKQGVEKAIFGHPGIRFTLKKITFHYLEKSGIHYDLIVKALEGANNFWRACQSGGAGPDSDNHIVAQLKAMYKAYYTITKENLSPAYQAFVEQIALQLPPVLKAARPFVKRYFQRNLHQESIPGRSDSLSGEEKEEVKGLLPQCDNAEKFNALCEWAKKPAYRINRVKVMGEEAAQTKQHLANNNPQTIKDMLAYEISAYPERLQREIKQTVAEAYLRSLPAAEARVFFDLCTSDSQVSSRLPAGRVVAVTKDMREQEERKRNSSAAEWTSDHE